MQRTSNLVVVVGIFFVIGVLMLMLFSLRATGPQGRGGYDLYTDVEDSKGLEIGAEVCRAGVPVGTVQAIGLAAGGENKVRVTMRIFKGIEVRKDAVASIELKSLLGTYLVHLSHGAAKAGAAGNADVLKSEELVDINAVLRTLGGLGDEMGGLVTSLDKNQAEFFEKINGIIDENRENVKTVSDALARSAPKIENFMDSISTVTNSITAGTGTIGKLFKDDEIYENVRVASANLEDISAKMRGGEGTLGKLIYDDEMAKQLNDAVTNVNSASKALKEVLDSNSGDVTGLAKSLREASDNLLEVSKKINSNEGTIGKLVNDPELYDEARRAITQIRKTFEEGEEQSVLRTFLGVFFGSMM